MNLASFGKFWRTTKSCSIMCIVCSHNFHVKYQVANAILLLIAAITRHLTLFPPFTTSRLDLFNSAYVQ